MSFLLPNPQKIDQCLNPTAEHPSYLPHPGQVLSQTYQLGGAGLSGTPRSYLTLLQSILAGGDPSTPSPLLSPATIQSMFAPQLTTDQLKQDIAAQTWEHSPWGWTLGPFRWLSEIQPNWGLGGALTGAPLASGRGKGALFWSGFANTFWVLDRERDVALVVWGNSIPHGDERLFECWEEVERLVYEALDETRGGDRRAAL